MTVHIAAGSNTINIVMQLILGNLTGKVTAGSPTGAPIQGAIVTLGVTPATTDANGIFNITGITPGDYPLTCTAAGYAPYSQ